MPFELRRAISRLLEPIVRSISRRRRHCGAARASYMHAVWLAALEADATPADRPCVSLVVPVYETPVSYLDELVASVRGQRPGTWELILSDDGSKSPATRDWLDAHAGDHDLVVLRNPINRGIVAATNAGIAVASCPWVGFLDHDDALTPHALDRIVRTLEVNPDCQYLYTDEVVTDARLQAIDLFLKPAFDPVLLAGANYLNHLSLYRRDRLVDIGALRPGFDGSQDYDLVLRYTAGLSRRQCLHLPYPAYLWRRDGASFSALYLEKATVNARRALAEAHARPDRTVRVDPAIGGDLHRVRFDLGRADWPPVSVIIPNRDAYDLISRLLHGLVDATDYPDFEIVIVDNGTTDQRVLDLYEAHRTGHVPFRTEIRPEPFNFSRAINRGIGLARGELLLMLNNDIEVITSGWLKEMVSCFDWPDTAIVGAKLLYPDCRIQHAGVIAGLGGLAGHWYIGQQEKHPGPMGRLWVRQSMSVVTGACLLVSRTAIDDIGLLDEEEFAIAYNDVDFCLRAVAAGYRVVWTPFATLVHHESASRGSDETPQNIERFRREQANLRRRHGTDIYEDPALNPWYSKETSTPSPIGVKRLPEAR